MPRQTRKYVSAMRIAETLGIESRDSQENLYDDLNSRGYFWESDQGEWQRTTEPPDPVTEVLRIRVWADAVKVEAMADQVVAALVASGNEILDISKPYPCRPPKQLESRIYLTFRMRPTAPAFKVAMGQDHIWQEPKPYDAVIGNKR